MRFETIAVDEALGWTLAHSLKAGKERIPKNSLITTEIIAQLQSKGITAVSAYLLEAGDIDENTAADKIAHHIAGPHIRVDEPARGRCNLYANTHGLFCTENSIDDLNKACLNLGVATLLPLAPVARGKLVATVKLISYGVATEEIKAVTAIAAKISVLPYKAFSAAVLATGTAMSSKAVSATKNRVTSTNGKIVSVDTCPHTEVDIAKHIKALASKNIDLLLISGISAISDRRDTVPTALETAGGMVIQLGMPVDPGNLLLIGKLDETTVIGMPGCAKSPSLNGFDWVLERFAAGLIVDKIALQNMGVGGLLKETIERPAPRVPANTIAAKDTPIVVLAAGKSSRLGPKHKLLAQLDNKPVITQSVLALKLAGFRDIYVVTGARATAIKAALAGLSIKLVNNPGYESGMASSLARGIAALPSHTEQCLICLADMPFVSSGTYEALIDVANQTSEAEIFVPHFKGKRGNPILWRKSQFKKLANISGDKGGRELINTQENLACTVPVDDPGILIDLDTPQAMAQFGIKVID